MKLASLTLTLSVAFLTAGFASAARLGAGAGASCSGKTDAATCDATQGCTWCVSQAIPSACYDADDAKKLPPGVFKCNAAAANQAAREQEAILTSTDPAGLCDPDVVQESGFLSIGSQKKYFYWMFGSRKAKPEDAPVILWMSGGPGCSSLLALFGELGPCSVNKDGATTKLNPYSWTEYANVVFIDQPPGTGFSTGPFDKNGKAVADDMYVFLQELFDAHPHLRDNDFYIAAESYGGHYAPDVAHRIFTGNKAEPAAHRINLVGVMIGNGLTDPLIQYKYYAEMAFNSGTARPACLKSSTMQ